MREFIDQYRHAYGVEPICMVMQVAPSGYWRYAAQQRNPVLRCASVQHDDVLSRDIGWNRRCTPVSLNETSWSIIATGARNTYP